MDTTWPEGYPEDLDPEDLDSEDLIDDLIDAGSTIHYCIEAVRCGQCGLWDRQKGTCQAGGGTWHADEYDFCSFGRKSGHYHIYLCANGDPDDAVRERSYASINDWGNDARGVPYKMLRETQDSIWFYYDDAKESR